MRTHLSAGLRSEFVRETVVAEPEIAFHTQPVTQTRFLSINMRAEARS